MAFFKGVNLEELKETGKSKLEAMQKELAQADAKAIGKLVEDGIRSAQDGMAKVDAAKVADKARSLASAGIEGTEKLLGKFTNNAPQENEPEPFKEFISLLWCLAYTDGEITPEERTRIAELACSLDESYEAYADTLEQELFAKINGHAREFGRENAAKLQSSEIISSLPLTARDAKLLCWNLLAIANADGISEAEVDFIRYVGEKTQLEVAVFEEFRNYNDALTEIEHARKCLKMANRSYAEIEPLVNELTVREHKIIEAAQALIADR